MAPKAHQTTIRFSRAMWDDLERAARRHDVSVAQYIREAARARLEHEDTDTTSREQELRTEAAMAASAQAQDNAFGAAEGVAALWEQGRLARERAQMLCAESRQWRASRSGYRSRPVERSESATEMWQKGTLARERAELDHEDAGTRQP